MFSDERNKLKIMGGGSGIVQENKGNLILSGNGEVAGGVFENVIINGNGTVNGEIECDKFECNGSAKIKGDILSRITEIKGNTKVYGNVEANVIDLQGNSNISGKITFERLVIKGNASLRNGIKGENVSLEGMVKINGDCEVENAYLNGAFTIDGLINGDKVGINLHGKSFVNEIGGEKISVKRVGHTFLHLDKLFKSLSKELHVELIEGDDIILEYTKAKTVRGNRVSIGPGCEIELLEYRNELTISDEALVKVKNKI
ncbi:polymer-forming cytoskeletal protein [Evansella sp. AB-P1]|uniref:polymer-forming cytoskeletal protein n=1 Tax=Evansella sp. AB-P1 TaxID=3037653 RepID=UPI00241C8743|nr:polymer-forming cytoskeletal protein [Evansella sp. AB-P1]MDG5786160.1 polymer-forming cytoskeletal protein [Evansella sp. AB-P1]